MRLLLYRPDYERLADRLQAFPGLDNAVMDDDRTAHGADGAAIDRRAVNPAAAYASSGLYMRGPVRAFFGVLRHAGTLRWLQSGGAGYDAPIFPRWRRAAPRSATATPPGPRSPTMCWPA